MNPEQTLPNDSDHSDPYLNGQSDAEKLMRRHLQTPGDVITEDELKNLKITGTADSIPSGDGENSNRRDSEDTEQREETPQTTPWDVIT